KSGFASLEAAQTWVKNFIQWYNHEHRHSKIRFVTPAERHQGRDHERLAKRHQVYLAAKAKTPSRWSGATRNWAPIDSVTLNPEKPTKEKNKAA
ncbi:MAG: IS3 family transposase, partial [Halothiobacillus sp.]